MNKFLESNVFRDRDLSVFNDNLELPRHRWYSFKEGFSTSLVNTAIKSVEGNTKQKLRLLDPFAGSGTTLVTAGQAGHDGTGIEVNPFLAFAGSVKCTSPFQNKRDLINILDQVLLKSRREKFSSLEGQSTFTEREGLQKWLFNRSVLRGFAAVDEVLREVRPKVRGPLRLALFASLMRNCNARRDGKCLRYRPEWKKSGFTSAELRKDFKEKSLEIFEDLAVKDFDSSGLKIIKGDAKEKLAKLSDEKFDLVVTSPPYLNSFDYSDVYRPELFVGGFVKTNEELRAIRKKTIRSHVQHVWEEPSAQEIPRLIEILTQFREKTFWSSQIPTMVAAYFEDMRVVLHGLAKCVKAKGPAWIIVSTSAYGGIEIPVDLILADIGEQVGWKLKSINVLRRMKSSNQHNSRNSTGSMSLRESLVILER